jgi:predicted dehydrogenase
MMLQYRINAGYLPPDHWTHGNEGGGRNLGEACHVYDLFTFLIDRPVAALSAHTIDPATDACCRDDNFAAVFHFEDGSIASLTYTALGSTDFPKERLEVYFDGKVVVLDDYRSLEVFGGRAGGCTTRQPAKGHRDELIAFADAIERGGDWPISWDHQMQATEMALAVERAMGGNA